MSTDQVFYSKRYNTMEEGTRLSIKNQSGIMITCVALEPFSVVKEKIQRLNRSKELHGIKLVCSKEQGALTIYYAPEDISNGLKYMKDSNGKLIYGKLNVYKDGKMIRLL